MRHFVVCLSVQRFLYETGCSLCYISQWWNFSALWSGPSKAVGVEISAVPCKSTPLVLALTCYMTKGIAKWLDRKCFALKYQTCNRITPLDVCYGHYVCMGAWRLDALAGWFRRWCSAQLKEAGALPFSKEWQFWLCPTVCSRWWVMYFVEIGGDSRG